jgi:hypothetical protein
MTLPTISIAFFILFPPSTTVEKIECALFSENIFSFFGAFLLRGFSKRFHHFRSHPGHLLIFVFPAIALAYS